MPTLTYNWESTIIAKNNWTCYIISWRKIYQTNSIKDCWEITMVFYHSRCITALWHLQIWLWIFRCFSLLFGFCLRWFCVVILCVLFYNSSFSLYLMLCHDNLLLKKKIHTDYILKCKLLDYAWNRKPKKSYKRYKTGNWKP